ncbi:MAG: cob(I)yrinic acid a,c-diamide adenosyltransferase [Firmicutes bacterium]|nr:cob(I)yrinic acid a,c-diamide adenosyltransferase [Bacillota bacterium]
MKVRIYTKNGDVGTTRLRDGSKVSKSHEVICALGDIDEIQAVLGMARAECAEPRYNKMLLEVERDLWTVMSVVAEVKPQSVISDGMKESIKIEAATGDIAEKTVMLEYAIDEMMKEVDLERGFILPGESKLSSYLDFARTVVRRAERQVVAMGMAATDVQKYLNRLSDWCWAFARTVEPQHTLSAVEEV